jgi:phospholipase C
MVQLTRRRLLTSAVTAATVGASASVLPLSVLARLDQPPPRHPVLHDIEHVVLVMQENRSFDHYFGTMAGVRGFGDPHALTLDTGRSVFYQPDPMNPDGYLLPFHLDTTTTSAQSIPPTGHEWYTLHAAWNRGRMDNWVPAHRQSDGVNGPFTMGYYTREDIPFQFALAEAFTVCDHFFCSVLGPTWPNRLYWMTGTIDAEGTRGGPIIRNRLPNGPYRWTTYAERLQRAGVSWKVYVVNDDFGLNMFPNFASFQQSSPGDPLYDQGLALSEPGTFEEDARNDRLPAVSWVLPVGFECEHPDYIPAAGADFLARTIGAIAANPKVWRKTAFILNYDENDGLFDHVPPPIPPPCTPGEWVEGEPIGGGFRVPAVVVSPWTAGGWVASERFDHTSVLQFLERFTGVEEPNISEWRRRTFGDLTSAFRFHDRHTTFPTLPGTAGALAQAKWSLANLPAPVLPAGGDQTHPVQHKSPRQHIPPLFT